MDKLKERYDRRRKKLGGPFRAMDMCLDTQKEIMTPQDCLEVAVPWNLPHYMPLKGFNPLYRALFELAEPGIALHAWDTIRLHALLSADPEKFKAFSNSADCLDAWPKTIVNRYKKIIAKTYQGMNNLFLTSLLPGHIELHHTLALPSFHRQFVLLCDYFAPGVPNGMFQEGKKFENQETFYQFCRSVLADRACLGIFSHIPETLDNIKNFVADPIIESKLYPLTIGLSPSEPVSNTNKDQSNIPIFLFMNNDGESPEAFYQGGGHIVLRFWKAFQGISKQGKLILQCAKPMGKELALKGVDVSFVNKEIGKSIYWFQDYLPEREKNSLMASARFLLMPGRYLKSETVLRAMEFGTIPVVSDTVGTSVFIKDHEHGIVLKGVREAAWANDPSTGLLTVNHQPAPELDRDLVHQMLFRISELLKNPDGVLGMQERITQHSRINFSGKDLTNHFWQTIKRLHLSRHIRSGSSEKKTDRTRELKRCLIVKEQYSGLFNGITRPRVRINTGFSRVWEVGDTIIQAPGVQNPERPVESADGHPWNPGTPDIKVVKDIHELDGAYLSPATDWKKAPSGITALVSKRLKAFPILYSAAYGVFKRYIATKTLARRYAQYLRWKFFSVSHPWDCEVLFRGVSGFDIVRCFHRYFAIPRKEGDFDIKKLKAGFYAKWPSGFTPNEVLKKVSNLQDSKASLQSVNHDTLPRLIKEGIYGYNILQFGNEFHAILQSEGVFIHEKLISGEYTRPYSGKSANEVERMIISGKKRWFMKRWEGKW